MEIKMDTTLEEKPLRDIWYVFRKIKDRLNRRIDESNVITYTVRLYPQDPNAPHPTEEQLIIKQLKDLKVIEEVEEQDDFEEFSENFKKTTRITPPTSKKEFEAWRKKRGNPKSVGITLHLKVKIPAFNKYYKKYKNKAQEYSSESPLDRLGRFCSFENDSLIMELPDGSPAPIVFSTRSGNRDMLSIFEIMFDQWKNSAELRNGWQEVIVTKDTLIGELARKGRTDISGTWIKDTISNIRNTKIKTSKLNNFVSLGYFDSKTKGWPFSIKRLTS